MSYTEPILFSDVNPDIGQNSPYELVKNESAIQKSILTILGTRKNTRPFRRHFGSYLQDLLFDPMDDFTGERIKTEIIRSIEEWEPRVTVKSSKVVPDFDKQLYYVEISFIIPKLNNKSVSLAFNLSTSK